MKISSFYLADISEYEDITNYICNIIWNKYYGVGVSSVSICRLMATLRKIIKTYVKLKYQKNISLITVISRFEEKLISNDSMNDGIVKLRISYDNVSDILNGKHQNLRAYIEEIIEQLETELTYNNKFSFTNYLSVQIDMLTEICLNELKLNYSDKELKEMIIKKDCWIKLSQQSSIFKDYYTSYMENKNNKKLFFTFLRGLVQKS